MISIKKWTEIEDVIKAHIPSEFMQENILEDLRKVLGYDPEKAKQQSRIVMEYQKKRKDPAYVPKGRGRPPKEE